MFTVTFSVVVLLYAWLIPQLIQSENDYCTNEPQSFYCQTEENRPNTYDYHYILHGATQQSLMDGCDPMSDAKCALKHGLEAGLEYFHDYNKAPFDDLGGPPEIDDVISPQLSFAMGDIYATATEDIGTYGWLLGKYELQTEKYNNKPVWKFTDKYKRDLHLFYYGSRAKDRRWIVGAKLGSDGAFIWAPSQDDSPVLAGHSWSNYNKQSWVPMRGIRFTPDTQLSPQLQNNRPSMNTVGVSPIEPIILGFSHSIERGHSGRILIEMQSEVEPTKQSATIHSSDVKYVKCEGDELVISYPLLPNAKVSISISPNFVHSSPQRDTNGNKDMPSLLTFYTGNLTRDWKGEASKYFKIAHRLSPNDAVPLIMGAALYNEYSRQDKPHFVGFMESLNTVLDTLERQCVEKQCGESERRELSERQSERLMLEGYSHIFDNTATAIEVIDLGLDVCFKQRYNYSLIEAGKIDSIGEYYCDMHTFDTYYRLPKGYHGNSLPNHFVQHYFPKAVRLKWFAHEYTKQFPDDLSILFRDSMRYTWDSISHEVQSAAMRPLIQDILLGTKNITEARVGYAQHGAVLLKNIISPLESDFLAKYFADAIRRKYPQTIASYDAGLVRSVFNSDRISFLWLVHLNKIMADIVGRPVKKAYSFLCGYEAKTSTRKPWLLGHTDREDNEFTFSVTITHDGGQSPPFPIYADPRRMPSRRKNYRMSDWSETIEFNNDIGDALAFKGRQHNHYRKDMPDHLSKYWTILFHFVPDEFDFVDFKQRGTSNSDI